MGRRISTYTPRQYKASRGAGSRWILPQMSRARATTRTTRRRASRRARYRGAVTLHGRCC
uniref:Expressed protein n=1 Tax=Schizophyllum commune (strain H4-8 / FGSC 9210) TaxID=578458 RepID=D8Q9Y3_SCHCM